jgi:hypothetical protein
MKSVLCLLLPIVTAMGKEKVLWQIIFAQIGKVMPVACILVLPLKELNG